MLEAIISGTIILILSIVIFFIKRKNPELRIGDVINRIILKDHVSVFVLIMIFVNVAEALWAASIKPVNQAEINTVTRFFGHITVQTLSITTGIMVSVYVKQIINKTLKITFWYVLLILMCIFMAIWLPLVNLFIIAGGLGQAKLLYWSMFNILEGFSMMQYGLQASAVLTIVHLSALLLDVIYIIATGKGLDLSTKDKEKKTPKEDEIKPVKETESPSGKYGIEQNISNLLKFLDRHGNVPYSENTVNRAVQKIRGMYNTDSAAQAKLVKRLNELDRQVRIIGQQGGADQTFINELVSSILDFWSNSPATGDGLGMPLRTRGVH